MMLSALLLSTLLGAGQEPPAAPAAAPAASAGSVDTHIAAGLAAFKKKRFRQAEIEFRQAVDADPNSAAANWYLGYTYYKIAEPRRPFDPGKQKAAELFAKAYQLDPQFRPVWSPSAPGGGGTRRSHRARPSAEPAAPATPPAKQG